MNFSFLAEALDEYDAAVDYYIERDEKVARAFVAEFEASVKQVSDSPTRWRREGCFARIYRMPNFPYSLIYHHSNSGVILVALAHNRRQPSYWQDRITR